MVILNTLCNWSLFWLEPTQAQKITIFACISVICPFFAVLIGGGGICIFLLSLGNVRSGAFSTLSGEEAIPNHVLWPQKNPLPKIPAKFPPRIASRKTDKIFTKEVLQGGQGTSACSFWKHIVSDLEVCSALILSNNSRIYLPKIGKNWPNLAKIGIASAKCGLKLAKICSKRLRTFTMCRTSHGNLRGNLGMWANREEEDARNLRQC